MPAPRIITRIHAPDGGALVRDLNPSTGYRRVTLTAAGGSNWAFGILDSRYVEGAAVDGPPRRTHRSRREVLHVFGDAALAGEEDAYWMSLEDRIEQLVQDTSSTFLWAIRDGGYLWTYRSVGPANVQPVSSEHDVNLRFRPVTLDFVVQPDPTKVDPNAPGGGA